MADRPTPIGTLVRQMLERVTTSGQEASGSSAMAAGTANDRDPLLAYRQETIVRLAGIPVRFRGASLDDLIPTPGNQAGIAAARTFLADPHPHRRGLLITGPVGTGKTHLAAAIALEEARKGSRVRFWPVPDLLAEIKASYDGEQGGSEHALMKRLGSLDLVILDDLGAERASEWTRQVFYTIVNRRYNDVRPVIVTTNLSLEALDQVVDTRLLSRLAGMCDVVAIQGEDWRLRREKP